MFLVRDVYYSYEMCITSTTCALLVRNVDYLYKMCITSTKCISPYPFGEHVHSGCNPTNVLIEPPQSLLPESVSVNSVITKHPHVLSIWIGGY